MTIQFDPAAGRTNSFMTATGNLVKCVEVLSTSEKMRDQLEDLIYDVIVTAEYGAFVAGFSAGQDYPGCKVEGVTNMDENKTIEERKAEIEECTRLLNQLTELIGSDQEGDND